MSTGEIIGLTIGGIGLCAMVPVWWLNSRLMGDKIKMTQQDAHIKSLQHQMDELRDEQKQDREKLNLLPLLEERMKNMNSMIASLLEKHQK